MLVELVARPHCIYMWQLNTFKLNQEIPTLGSTDKAGNEVNLVYLIQIFLIVMQLQVKNIFRIYQGQITPELEQAE